MFNDWLLCQANRRDAVGKFARSMKLDRCWPKNADDYVTLRTHIRAYHHNNSYASRITAFEVAWEEYQAALIAESQAMPALTTISQVAAKEGISLIMASNEV
ncbi:MAG: sterile alpha motif-like domain-containing protein [Nitrososphaerales archaeon]